MTILTKIYHTTPSTTFLLLLLLTHHTHAQPNTPGRSQDTYGGSFSPSMGVIIIVLIAALFFMGFFSIYIRHCSDDSSTTAAATRRALGSIRHSRRAPRGLDQELINSFPTFDYAAVKSAKIGKGALECAVCLTEFEDEDTLRLIPKCDHVFHPDCIDTWLEGHTTCPVCRCNLAETTTNSESQQVDQNHVILGVDLEGSINNRSHDDHINEDNYHHHIEENEANINNNNSNESIEEPLQGRVTMNRNRTIRNLSFGRPRLWFGKYTRSYSTGHVAVKQWENMDRFTLRLPEEIRKQIISGKLERSTSLVVLPRETSSRRGYRTGLGEGTSTSNYRLNRFGGSVRVDNNRTGRSDRWVFKLAPPFFGRAPSLKSPNKVGPIVISPSSRSGSLHGGQINRDGSLRGAMQAEFTQLPV